MNAGIRGRAGRLAALLIGAAAVLGATEARAQVSLEDYDYDNLGLRAIGAEILWVDASQTDGTVGFGARADLGYLGPHVRIVPRVAYWSADVNDSEVRKLEEQLQETCSEPCEIQLGSLKRSAFILGADAQWTLLQSSLRPYVGAGLDIYFLDDSGDAIRGTFLDNTVITAGISGLVGLELDFLRRWRAFGELRGTLVTDATNWNAAAGIAWRL
jgi:hypothetical protein